MVGEVGVVELIDTQWDVNIVASRHDYVNVFELIDTQWDVNFFIIRLSIKCDRINRYIVGCKF